MKKSPNDKTNNKELKDLYELVCNVYVERFCEKQDMSNEGWVGDDRIGEVIVCSDFFFDFHDIKRDLDTQQPKGQIIDWYYDCYANESSNINYSSYCMGLRPEDVSSKNEKQSTNEKQ